MGKPDTGNAVSSRAEFIGARKRTGGSETSQYPQEQKSTEIPIVAVSELGRAQTTGSNTGGVVGQFRGLPGELQSQTIAEGCWKAPS